MIAGKKKKASNCLSSTIIPCLSKDRQVNVMKLKMEGASVFFHRRCLQISLSIANCRNVEVMGFIFTHGSFETTCVKLGFGGRYLVRH